LHREEKKSSTILLVGVHFLSFPFNHNCISSSPILNLEPKCMKGPILYFAGSMINLDDKIMNVKLAHVRCNTPSYVTLMKYWTLIGH
jgi:hypothetical protein